MERKPTEAQRMDAELIETARGLRRSGIVSRATLNRVAARDLEPTELPKVKQLSAGGR